MKAQQHAMVQPRFLRTGIFMETIAPILATVRDLLLTCGIPEVKLRSIDSAPESLALAVYGVKGSARFLGFDLDSNEGFLAGLIFEVPLELLNQVSDHLERAWELALTVEAALPRN